MNFRSIIFFLSLLIVPLLAFAGTTGKIAGKVTDKSTGEPLPGANILIEGTTLGAAANINGEFIILNIPPGVYSVKAMMIGYQTMVTKEVRVSIDVTTKTNFALSLEALDLGESVEIVAERELIQKDLTATTAIVDAENISKLPVTEISEVVNLQAGVVESNGLHIRGGRSGEVAYWIDGVPVTDVYDGSSVVDVNKNLVQELQVISGAFNAEYGQALSGIVNVATKDGSNRFGGSISSYIGDYVSGHDKFSWGKYPDQFASEAVQDVPFFLDIDNIDPLAIRNFEGSLFGPLIKDKLFYFVSGRYIYFDGWLRGQNRYNPFNIGFTDSTGTFIPSRDESGLGDNSFVPMNWNRKLYSQTKLIYKFSPTLRFTNTTIIDNLKYQDYDRSYIFNPDGNLNKFRNGLTSIFKMSHMLGSRTFYDLAVSYTDKVYKQYVYEDINDPNYVHPRLLDQQQYSFKTGGTNLQHFKRQTSTLLYKFDVTSQVTNVHQLKLGLEYRRHRIFFENIFLRPVLTQSDIDLSQDSPFIKTEVPALDELGHDKYTQKPHEFSAYVQDKIELQNFIVNMGFRMDVFEPNGRILADPSDPNIYNPIKPENRFNDVNENGVQDADETVVTVDERRQYWYKPARSKVQLSPRLGVSFPVTNGGVFHFSFGYFFQIPNFDLLYQNHDFKIGSGTGNVGLIGNADLEPEQTINGEIGLKQEVSNDATLEVTAYIRDIRNLTSTTADAISIFGGAAEYNKYVNADFGFVRGVVLSFNKRLGSGFLASADYTYQIAKATNSDPQQARNARLGGALPEVQLTSVPWDQLHSLNISIAYSAGSWGGGLIVKSASGQPYTPRRDQDISTLAINSERKPSLFDVDLRLYRDFKFGNNLTVTLFSRVLNLFDTLNQLNVFDDTGKADFTTDRNKTIRTVGLQTPVNLIDEWYTNPTNFSEPRRIELGLQLNF